VTDTLAPPADSDSEQPGVDPGGLMPGAPAAVRAQVNAGVPLPQFLSGAGTLTLADRRRLVEQALILLEQNYVHLTLKSAMYAVNPVQRLRLLLRRLERQTSVDQVPEWRFHQEMSSIFHSVRDLHTNYLLPAPFNGRIAYLPFLVEEYRDAAGPHYIVSRVVQGFSAPGFTRGTELTSWNGMTVDTAVELNADRFAGSNAAARHARGVESLTIRSLRSHLPPSEQWVVVGYRGADGIDRELRQDWLVVGNLPPFAEVDTLAESATVMGVDIEADEIGRMKTLLYAPAVADHELSGSAGRFAGTGADLPTSLPTVFRARTVATAAGTFGHLRIFTFSVNDPAGFVAEFVRLIELLPQNGLILDVRGNGGGHIYASEFTLQTLTPRPIVPEPVQFSAKPLNLAICRQHANNPLGIDLGPWVRSLDQALETGSGFSAAFPITPTDGANRIGQRYHGPVVLITDARCYSATDIFAAGFQDHGIGPVLGAAANTGAGGANVWTHGLLKQLLEQPAPVADSPFEPLPGGADMRVAIRRTLRVGALAGTPVEDLGVEPDVRHDLTRADILDDNRDLLDRAGQLLAARPVRALVVQSASASTDSLTLQVRNLDRVDVAVNDRPVATMDVADGVVTLTVPLATADRVTVNGFDAGVLVAARRFVVG
jgi:hypothetical protein